MAMGKFFYLVDDVRNGSILYFIVYLFEDIKSLNGDKTSFDPSYIML
jgi:hypothetical protein